MQVFLLMRKLSAMDYGKGKGRDLPEVDDFVEKLVDEDEVVLNVLLADLAEVGLHDVAHLQEELEDHRGVYILL